MPSNTRTQNSYDHRLRDLVHKTGDIKIAIERGVPRSTARGTPRSSRNKVISIDVFDIERKELEHEVVKLRQTVKKLRAILRLFIVVLKISGFSLSKCRIPDGDDKSKILKAIELSQDVLSLSCIFKVLKVSPSRYHAWKRSLVECDLEDHSTCPKSTPQKIALEEKLVIREMITSQDYRHVPTGTLAVLAQRLGKVYASASTWYRLVREHGWRRPRKRIHPQRNTLGIRALKPNEIWHIDTTIIKLLDGSRLYLHAVIDNFSRKILSWKIFDSFNPTNSILILSEAAQLLLDSDDPPDLIVDGGVENYNHVVDQFINSGILKRVLAQTEISFSNSMIESWWRSLKHQWLYLNTLDSYSEVKRLISFYVEEHNVRLPHSAFKGQTPDEIFYGRGDRIPERLRELKAKARKDRITKNRSLQCQTCK